MGQFCIEENENAKCKQKAADNGEVQQRLFFKGFQKPTFVLLIVLFIHFVINFVLVNVNFCVHKKVHNYTHTYYDGKWKVNL